MTASEIKTHLRVFLSRVLGLLPEAQRAEAGKKIYVAGGAIVSLCLDEPPVDYDVFCDDAETADMFSLATVGMSGGAELLAQTENALTFRLATGEIVQLVTRFTGPPSRVFDSFDWSHCKCYYRLAQWFPSVQHELPEELVYNPELIQSRKLIYDGNKDEFALNTLKRGFKFAARGWQTDNASVMRLYEVIQNSPSIRDPKEHRKQTVGYYGSAFK